MYCRSVFVISFQFWGPSFRFLSLVPVLGVQGTSTKATLLETTLSQRALRDRLMSRGKNCLPTVSRQFLTRNYPLPNCLLKCLPNCLSPTREGFLILFQNYPRGEGNCETSERQKLSRGNFCPATSICLFWPTGFVNSFLTLEAPKQGTC